jgi:non-ribosomal peptide synthetase component E (peptide arylation enzyme)
MDATMLAGLIAQGLTLATVLAGIGVAMFNRRWAAQDRKAAAVIVEAERQAHAAEVNNRLDLRAAEIQLALEKQAELVRVQLDGQAELLKLRQQMLEHKIDSNTELTGRGIAEVKAFADVANNVNEKIRSIGLDRRRDDLLRNPNPQL